MRWIWKDPVIKEITWLSVQLAKSLIQVTCWHLHEGHLTKVHIWASCAIFHNCTTFPTLKNVPRVSLKYLAQQAIFQGHTILGRIWSVTTDYNLPISEIYRWLDMAPTVHRCNIYFFSIGQKGFLSDFEKIVYSLHGLPQKKVYTFVELSIILKFEGGQMNGRVCAKPTIELVQTGQSLILKFQNEAWSVWTNSMVGVSHSLLFL